MDIANIVSVVIAASAALLGALAGMLIEKIFVRWHLRDRRELQIRTAGGQTMNIQASELTREKAEEIISHLAARA
ncbi:MAG TPA: hypothetical protein VMD78_07900 [Candidatus Baltobacteraceae bacterium]|nr:hypothetical protein [Candidatus Baltobacteraceae bacterium]